ncbi:SRPBCC family protein [Flavobacterium subsaxonicum]|uniref:Cell division protein n=1 Tax=Flavobacterium subsaxonicum WB 4.1-42 = DSM 21790 TaxID=1121898 RepID=A0A0A2MIY7_9FLAO|nr:SRPBCC family protein [Flavobacterium subsaxonicum]KGO91458.1 cell division protein [Flavobacterium subsaxonicum WB 4.1-42 = DSM 21790]
MPRLKLQTVINAPIAVVFDLSRSVDLHKISTTHTNERAVAGKTEGLMDLNDSVTWQARHLGITQRLSSKITTFNRPYFFADEMVQGAFKNFRHEHIFTEENGQAVMTDIFDYTSPFGMLGRLADSLFLSRYMYKLLAERNRIVKAFAEDPDKYKKILL